MPGCDVGVRAGVKPVEAFDPLMMVRGDRDGYGGATGEEAGEVTQVGHALVARESILPCLVGDLQQDDLVRPPRDHTIEQVLHMCDAIGLDGHELRVGEDRDLGAQPEPVIGKVNEGPQLLPVIRPCLHLLSLAAGERDRCDFESVPCAMMADHGEHSEIIEPLVRQICEVRLQSGPVASAPPERGEVGNAEPEKRAAVVLQAVPRHAHVSGAGGLGGRRGGACEEQARQDGSQPEWKHGCHIAACAGDGRQGIPQGGSPVQVVCVAAVRRGAGAMHIGREPESRRTGHRRGGSFGPEG